MKYEKLIKIFILAFAINLVWERLHYGLYVPHHFLAVSDYAYLLGAFLDAIYVSLAIFLFSRFAWWAPVVATLGAGILIEKLALSFNWWSYGSMPVLPLLNTGLSPTIQLVSTVLIIYLFFYTPKFSFIVQKSSRHRD